MTNLIAAAAILAMAAVPALTLWRRGTAAKRAARRAIDRDLWVGR